MAVCLILPLESIAQSALQHVSYRHAAHVRRQKHSRDKQSCPAKSSYKRYMPNLGRWEDQKQYNCHRSLIVCQQVHALYMKLMKPNIGLRHICIGMCSRSSMRRSCVMVHKMGTAAVLYAAKHSCFPGPPRLEQQPCTAASGSHLHSLPASPD